MMRSEATGKHSIIFLIYQISMKKMFCGLNSCYNFLLKFSIQYSEQGQVTLATVLYSIVCWTQTHSLTAAIGTRRIQLIFVFRVPCPS
jgi:hypothetical protein